MASYFFFFSNKTTENGADFRIYLITDGSYPLRWMKILHPFKWDHSDLKVFAFFLKEGFSLRKEFDTHWETDSLLQEQLPPPPLPSPHPTTPL